MSKVADRVIREWIQKRREDAPERINKLISQANLDLYYGSIAVDDAEYPGFTEACKELSAHFDDVEDIYVNTFMEVVCDKEPEPYYDEELDEYIEEDPSDWVRCNKHYLMVQLVGDELASYL